MTTSWQLSAGLEQTFAGRLELQLDAYRKWLSDVVERRTGQPPAVHETGRAWGVELVTRYRLREHVFLWGWLAASRSTVGPEQRPSDADQPVTGGLVMSWDPSDRWTLGLRYRYGSGRHWTPIEGSLYDATRDAWIPLPGAENSEQMPGYHKLDLRVAYTIPFERWSLSASAEAWIVPASSAQLYPTWSYDYREQGWVRGPVFLPLLGLRATF